MSNRCVPRAIAVTYTSRTGNLNFKPETLNPIAMTYTSRTGSPMLRWLGLWAVGGGFIDEGKGVGVAHAKVCLKVWRNGTRFRCGAL